MLFLLGYALAVPVALRFAKVATAQKSIGLLGHQLGVIIAGIGWALRGKLIIVGLHVVWLVVAKIWFSMAKGGAKAAE